MAQGEGIPEVTQYIKKEFARMRGGWEPSTNIPVVEDKSAYEPNFRDTEPTERRSMLEAENVSDVIEFELVPSEQEPEVYTTQQRIEHERQAQNLFVEAVEQVSLLPTETTNDVHHIVAPSENIKLAELYKQCLKSVAIRRRQEKKQESFWNKRVF